jgi:steroid delta-isomerase-like uncharacterized protein
MAQGDKVLRTWFLELWNAGRLDLFSQLAEPDIVFHTVGIQSERLVGIEGFRTLYERLHAAFSGITFTVEETIESGDAAAIRWTCRMKHVGDQMGVKATGKPVQISGMAFIRLKNGKAAEAWDEWDRLGLMTQIGAVKS